MWNVLLKLYMVVLLGFVCIIAFWCFNKGNY